MAKPGKVFIVRHGETPFNSGDVKRIRGWIDVPLNSKGMQEAHQAAKSLSTKGLSHIFSSDLTRTQQMADVIGQRSNLQPSVTSSLRPWHLGIYEGQPVDKAHKALEHYYQNPDEKVPGGESYNDFKGRFIPFLKSAMAFASTGKNVALVTHYRNVKAAEGWLKAGMEGHNVDEDTMRKDNIHTGEILSVDPDGSFEKL